MPEGVVISQRGPLASVYVNDACVLFRVPIEEAEAYVATLSGAPENSLLASLA